MSPRSAAYRGDMYFVDREEGGHVPRVYVPPIGRVPRVHVPPIGNVPRGYVPMIGHGNRGQGYRRRERRKGDMSYFRGSIGRGHVLFQDVSPFFVDPEERGHVSRVHVPPIVDPEERGHVSRVHVPPIVDPEERGHVSRVHVPPIVDPEERGHVPRVHAPSSHVPHSSQPMWRIERGKRFQYNPVIYPRRPRRSV